MNMKRYIKYAAIVTALVVIGILIIVLNKFEFNVNYSKNVRLEINMGEAVNIGEIVGITNQVYEKQVPIIRTVGEFGEVIAITVKDSTEEQNNMLIEKINEKFEKSFTTDDIKMYYNSNVKGTDIIAPYIIPSIIALILISVFFAVRYRKLGIVKTLAIFLGTIIGTGILYMALSSLFKMEINEASVIGGIAIVIFCSVYMANSFEKLLNTKK